MRTRCDIDQFWNISCYYGRLCDTYVVRLARAAVPDRFKVHHSGLAVVVSVLMPVFMIVTVGFAMVMTVSMRVIVPVVFCRERQCLLVGCDGESLKL